MLERTLWLVNQHAFQSIYSVPLPWSNRTITENHSESTTINRVNRALIVDMVKDFDDYIPTVIIYVQCPSSFGT